MDGSSCTTPRPCAQGKTFLEAQAICAENGRRLCSLAEAASNMCCNTGCAFDRHHIWTHELEPAAAGIVTEYSVMTDKMSKFESVIEQRPKELAASFVAGFFSLVAGFGALRLFRKSNDEATDQWTQQAESGSLLGPEAVE